MMNRTIIALSLMLSSVAAYANEVSLIVKEHGGSEYKTITVAASDVELIKNSGQYESVEEDVWLSIPTNTGSDFAKETVPHESLPKEKGFNVRSMSTASAATEPNDPEYKWQYYWKGQDLNLGSSEINKAVNKSVANKKLRVAVIDGGFVDNPDITWTDGYNFFEDWGSVPGPEFRTLSDPDNCETGHGVAVASIIGAKQNNGVGIAGVLDAEMVPVRAFQCNLAKLSVVAKAIRYAAGDQVDAAPIIAPVDIINISMGGEIETCPAVLQEAIDYAVARDIQIYVASGNQGKDVNGIVPAKCNNVTVIGATNQRRVKASFSNYGSLVDYMAAGFDVVSYDLQGRIGWWEGTSFSSPLAAAIHGLAKQHNPKLTREEILNLITVSADKMSTDIAGEQEDCSGDRCGAGLINASRMMDYVIAASSGDLFTIRHALSKESTCSQELYLSKMGNALKLCQMYEVVLNPQGDKFDNAVQLVRVQKGQSLNSKEAEMVVNTTDSIFLIDGVDAEEYDYGVKMCSDTNCETTPAISIKVNVDTVPANCK